MRKGGHDEAVMRTRLTLKLMRYGSFIAKTRISFGAVGLNRMTTQSRETDIATVPGTYFSNMFNK